MRVIIKRSSQSTHHDKLPNELGDKNSIAYSYAVFRTGSSMLCCYTQFILIPVEYHTHITKRKYRASNEIDVTNLVIIWYFDAPHSNLSQIIISRGRFCCVHIE
jgi:hypothetical protein